jgi:hypothetical protein
MNIRLNLTIFGLQLLKTIFNGSQLV